MKVAKSANNEAIENETSTAVAEPAANSWNNVSEEDALPCFLTIVQRTSKATELGANPGSIAIIQGEAADEVEDGARIRICKIMKRYERDLDYDSDEEQMTFESMEQVEQEGFTSDDVREIFDIDVLVQTEHPSARFLETGGDGEKEPWVLASARWRKTSCKAARTIITALNNRAVAIGEGFVPFNTEFRLYVKRNEFRKNVYYTPAPRIVSEPVGAIASPRLFTA